MRDPGTWRVRRPRPHLLRPLRVREHALCGFPPCEGGIEGDSSSYSEASFCDTRRSPPSSPKIVQGDLALNRAQELVPSSPSSREKAVVGKITGHNHETH